MTTKEHETFVYIGLAGEGENIGPGGMYRRGESDQEWRSITQGLPPEPQVRSLLVHPENPAVIFAGTQAGPYRSDDRGEHWEALDAPARDVWSRRSTRKTQTPCSPATSLALFTALRTGALIGKR